MTKTERSIVLLRGKGTLGEALKEQMKIYRLKGKARDVRTNKL